MANIVRSERLKDGSIYIEFDDFNGLEISDVDAFIAQYGPNTNEQKAAIVLADWKAEGETDVKELAGRIPTVSVEKPARQR